MRLTQPNGEKTAGFAALVDCVRGEAEALRARGLAEPETLRETVTLAERHGLESVVHLVLQESALGGRVPAARLQRLHETHRANVKQYVLGCETTLRALEVLGERGIGDALPIKGMALAAVLWPEFLPRQLVDVDLVVPPERIEAARAALREAGFHSPAIPWTPNRWEYHLPRLERGGMALELHWRLWPPSPLQPFALPTAEQLAARQGSGLLNDREVAVPSLVDQFVILAASLAEDGFAVQLRHWADLYWVLKRFTPQSTAELSERLRAPGLGPYLGLVLRFLGEIWGELPVTASADGRAEGALATVRPVVWRRLETEEPVRASVWLLRLLHYAAAEPEWEKTLPPFLREQARVSAPRSAITHCGGALWAAGKACGRLARLALPAERQALREELLLARVLGELTLHR